MTTAEALSRPVNERYRQAEDIAIAQARLQVMSLARQQAAGADDPARGGPVLRV